MITIKYYAAEMYTKSKLPNRVCKDIAVQSLSCVLLFVTPWIVARQASLSFTIFWSLLKLVSVESMMLSKCIKKKYIYFLMFNYNTLKY